MSTEEANRAPIPFQVSCVITSHSHIVPDGIFAELSGPKSSIRVDVESDRRLRVTCVNISGAVHTLEAFAPIAHVSISWFIVALCAGSLGHFAWEDGGRFSGAYTGIDPSSPDTTARMASPDGVPLQDDRKLTAEDVQRAYLLCGALMRDVDPTIRHEYAKGLVNLEMTYFEASFRKEAYHNFYRVSEYLLVQKFLEGKRPRRDVTEYMRVLKELGADAALVDEFRELYILRSEQVDHAQIEQSELTDEAPLKMKTLSDLLINKAYERVWKEALG